MHAPNAYLLTDYEDPVAAAPLASAEAEADGGGGVGDAGAMAADERYWLGTRGSGPRRANKQTRKRKHRPLRAHERAQTKAPAARARRRERICGRARPIWWPALPPARPNGFGRAAARNLCGQTLTGTDRRTQTRARAHTHRHTHTYTLTHTHTHTHAHARTHARTQPRARALRYARRTLDQVGGQSAGETAASQGGSRLPHLLQD